MGDVTVVVVVVRVVLMAVVVAINTEDQRQVRARGQSHPNFLSRNSFVEFMFFSFVALYCCCNVVHVPMRSCW